MSRKELISQLAYENIRSKSFVDSISTVPMYTASKFIKAKTPDTFNAWIKLDLCDRDDVQDCYYLSRIYDNYTSLSVYNPTNLEFRIFFTVNGDKILTFYDVLPGNNVFELFVNDFPRFQLDFDQVYLIVRLKNSAMKFLTHDKVDFGPLEDKARLLQTQVRAEIVDLDKKIQLKNSDQNLMLLDHKNTLHLIQNGYIKDSCYFGQEVEEIQYA